MLAERGHVQTTSTRVSKRAGVSPATFYQHFDNIGDCLLAAYEAGVGCVWDIVSEACREEEIGWPQRLGVAVASTLRFLAVEPALAFLLGDEAPAGEVAIAAARRRAIERLAGLLAGGRALRPAEAGELPAATERHLIAGAIAIYAERVAAGDVERLPELGPQLIEMLTAPYVAPACGRLLALRAVVRVHEMTYRGGGGTPRSCWSFCLLGSSGSPRRAHPRPSARGSNGCRCPAHSQYPPGISAASSQIVSGNAPSFAISRRIAQCLEVAIALSASAAAALSPVLRACAHCRNQRQETVAVTLAPTW